MAEIIQRANPDIVLLNEFDFVAGRRRRRPVPRQLPRGAAGHRRRGRVPVRVRRPVEHRHRERLRPQQQRRDGHHPAAPGYGDDAFGFGAFEGQFGMAVLSKYPIVEEDVRTFQHFLWKDMPGALLPDDPNTAAPADWYSPAELDVFRLSSKSHWDVPGRRRRQHGARARVAPDAADVRRPRRPQRPAQPRRDPVLGRLRHARHDVALHLRRRRRHRRAEARRVVRDPRRPERRPVRRRLGGCRDPPAARPPADDRLDADVRRARPRHPRCRAARTSRTRATRPRHRRLQRQPGAGQPARRLRAAVARPARDATPPCSGRSQADPLSALTGTFPFPSSDHRLVWVDLRVHG